MPAHLIGIVNADGLKLEDKKCTVGEVRPEKPRREPSPPFQLQPRLQQQQRLAINNSIGDWKNIPPVASEY